jgi:hypothetical protein
MSEARRQFNIPRQNVIGWEALKWFNLSAGGMVKSSRGDYISIRHSLQVENYFHTGYLQKGR